MQVPFWPNPGFCVNVSLLQRNILCTFDSTNFATTKISKNLVSKKMFPKK